jgi:hypothetical protein
MTSLWHSPGLRMALMRSTIAASTWIALHWPPCGALGQRRGDGVIGPSSAAHSREVRPRRNFRSLGPCWSSAYGQRAERLGHADAGTAHTASHSVLLNPFEDACAIDHGAIRAGYPQDLVTIAVKVAGMKERGFPAIESSGGQFSAADPIDVDHVPLFFHSAPHTFRDRGRLRPQ